MLLRGCFIAAKKVAVALDTAVGRGSRAATFVIGFACYAGRSGQAPS
jgi:hypothetical protein